MRPLLILTVALLATLLSACAPRAIESNVGKPLAVELLQRVNEVRRSGGSCAGQRMPAVRPLALNNKLSRAAQLHTLDMKDHALMSHRGSDGSTVGERVTRQGYRWTYVAENVAFGYPSAAAVMAGWMASEGHCRSILGASYLQLGVGEAGGFWTQVFATPR